MFKESEIDYEGVRDPGDMPRPGPARWSGVLWLGLAGAVAAALPVTGVVMWSERTPGDRVRAFEAAVVAVLGLLVAVPVLISRLRSVRESWPRHPKAALAAVFVADAAAMLVLTWVLPFRAGLLSCLLYCAPALLVSAAALLRSRTAVLMAAVGLAALFSLAAPLQVLQQHVATREWARATGLPSRSIAQVVTFPGMTQDPYSWDGRTLTAMFSLPVGPSNAWLGAETAQSGYVDPCGPVLIAEGDASRTATPPCVQEAPNLWYRGTRDDAEGYVLHRSGVTVIVTGGAWSRTNESDTAYAAERRAGLRRVVLGARTATDADLWTRSRLPHPTLLGLLLL
ncbi:hypothetical protein EV644_101341 [Kribbella orskensis]|uniref:Uncharacterized protein n=2 Tax=Kribbellaceae TaxID=2726069 RepID=A0ABY2BUJ1_9ACTN|nr:hypothetical protein EV642_101648 [Kribbella sp. VKM Ac-2500]TCO31699.1 hypothetical protein EV644_101341 [Kribbella orskensis]